MPTITVLLRHDEIKLEGDNIEFHVEDSGLLRIWKCTTGTHKGCAVFAPGQWTVMFMNTPI